MVASKGQQAPRWLFLYEVLGFVVGGACGVIAGRLALPGSYYRAVQATARMLVALRLARENCCPLSVGEESGKHIGVKAR